MSDRTAIVFVNHNYAINKNIERPTANKPELRQEIVYNKLRQQFTVHFPTMKLTEEIILKLNVHSKDYLEFLKHAYNSFLATCAETNINDEDYNKVDGLIPYHFADKSTKLETALPYWKRMGYYCDDNITPITSVTYLVSMESANICYEAANLINNYDLIYCLTTYPGHHARNDGYSGYCFLNNAYICAAQLLEHGHKVAVCDIDYHAGCLNIINSKNLLKISIHADPKYEYPTFSGHESENTELSKNIIFKRKAKWNDYKLCLDQALTYIKDFNPTVLIIPFGGDTYKDDPDPSKLYGCSLDDRDYYEIGIEISKLNIKMIVTQEGGYVLEKIADIVHNLLNGLIKKN